MDNNHEESSNLAELWTSISDLMSGLMLVFLLIAVAFMIEIKNSTKDQIDYKNRLEKILKNYTLLEKELSDDLREAFPEDFLKKWDIELTKDNTFRFLSPDVKFENGSSKVRAGFKFRLQHFFPKYVEILSKSKYRDFIEEIRVEGHTSSVWFGISKKEDYLKNLELSQDRARAVLTYCINLPEVQDSFNWLTSVFRANGLSSAKLLDENRELISISGLPEDEEQSRRVEFRIMTKARKALDELEKLREDMENRKK